jgi:hypothetical protein
MLRTTFNTGRPYTTLGQVIISEFRDDGMVYFSDTSRGIFGKFEPIFTPECDRELRAETLAAYDSGHYTDVGFDVAPRA